MPKFYFDVGIGTVKEDRAGTELASLGSAHDEAVRLLAGLLNEDPHHLRRDNRRVTVRGADGRILLEVGAYSFAFEGLPLIPPAKS